MSPIPLLARRQGITPSWTPARLNPAGWWDIPWFVQKYGPYIDGTTPNVIARDTPAVGGKQLAGYPGLGMPTILNAGINGKPSLYFDRTTACTTAANQMLVGSPVSILAVLDADPGEPQVLTAQEQGFEGSGLGRWAAANLGTDRPAVAVDSTWARTGTNSMKISIGTLTATEVNGGQMYATMGDFSMLFGAGHNYTIKGWQFFPTGTAATDRSGFAVFTRDATSHVYTQFNGSNVTFPGAGIYYDFTHAGTWQQFSVTLTVPSNADQSFIRCAAGWNLAGSVSATSWWEDFSFLDNGTNIRFRDVTPMALTTSLSNWQAGSSKWWDNGFYSAVIGNGLWNGTNDLLTYSANSFMTDAGIPHVVDLVVASTRAATSAFEDGTSSIASYYATAGAAYGQDPGTDATTGVLYLGALAGQSGVLTILQPYKGRMSEIVVVNRAISALELASWHRYAQKKYNITVAGAA